MVTQKDYEDDEKSKKTLEELYYEWEELDYEDDEKSKKTWEELDYDTKLNVLRHIGKILVEHAREGGSYRYLLYERLDLDLDAYGYLLNSFMDISNEFSIIKSVQEDSLIHDFNEIINKIPAFLTKEDKEQWNFNGIRGKAFDFLFLVKGLNEALYKSEEKYNRLLQEYKNLQNKEINK